MSWTEVALHLKRESRLLVPVGTCDQHGPHLPIGAGTRLAEALADDLAAEFGVLRAPTLHYGVNLPSPRCYPGAATLRDKTLHRVLNELLASWRAGGFTEFVVISGEAHDHHVESVATVSVRDARVRVIEPLSVDLSSFSDATPEAEHGGEVLTSLLLYLAPELVNMEAARNYRLPRKGKRWARGGRLSRIPPDGPGLVGRPTLATAAQGERMYRHILEKIRCAVFGAPVGGAQPG